VAVEVIPVPGIPEVSGGNDLAALIGRALRSAGIELLDGDVVVVTQKVVSKAEGRVVPAGPEGKTPWVERETRRVVARRGDLIIAETRHGFVCANAGVDASNVADGFLTLLPLDPDASAERIRSSLRAAAGAEVAVVISDTFGRPWRMGVVNVAIGCAGLPSLVDLRGTKDATGRVLEATVVALADEVAAAGGLVMGKAEGVPAAIVRGLRLEGAHAPASALVREPFADLFRESPLQAIHARRSIGRFGSGPVPRESLLEAVAAACTAPAPDLTRPWLFVALESAPARNRLLASVAEAPLEDAPIIIVPCVRMTSGRSYPGEQRGSAESEMLLLSGGGAIQNLMLALHAGGLASCWTASTLFCKEETREALGLGDEWMPLGSVAVGPFPEGEPPPRPAIDPRDFLRVVE
jgi:coenzyme F420-0:L-glutamate ligase / coenzyme F420-1:gamma-L-glutamate ligase